MNWFLGWDAGRAAIACCFIFITTADDTVWLVPMLSTRKYRQKDVLLHALMFCGTLQLVCLACWVICVVFAKTMAHVKVGEKDVKLETLLQLSAIIITWAVAAFLFVKKMIKLYWKRQQLAANARHNVNYEAIRDPEMPPEYPSPHLLIEEVTPPLEDAQPISVFFLTIVGALDEMMCFPSFLLAGTFSIWELSFGCLMASLFILLSITVLFSACQPILNCFDKIPLYAIVALYACYITIAFFVN